MKTMKFKRAMLMLTLLVMTLSAVTGGTIAWFTDSVNSANNVIKAGNLDIELYHDNGVKVTADTELFTLPTLWEPGAVAWENLTVKNEGDLALKYEMVMNATEENTVNGYGLSSALKVGIVEGTVAAGAKREDVISQVSEWTTFSEFVATGKLLPEDSDLEVDGAVVGSKTYGVVIYWQPGENDNNWNVNNGKKVSDYTDDANNYLRITLGVKLEATQLMAEEDSFDNQYDAEAELVSVNESLAITNNAGKLGETVTFNAEMPYGTLKVTVPAGAQLSSADVASLKLTVKKVNPNSNIQLASNQVATGYEIYVDGIADYINPFVNANGNKWYNYPSTSIVVELPIGVGRKDVKVYKDNANLNGTYNDSGVVTFKTDIFTPSFEAKKSNITVVYTKPSVNETKLTEAIENATAGDSVTVKSTEDDMVIVNNIADALNGKSDVTLAGNGADKTTVASNGATITASGLTVKDMTIQSAGTTTIKGNKTTIEDVKYQSAGASYGLTVSGSDTTITNTTVEGANASQGLLLIESGSDTVDSVTNVTGLTITDTSMWGSSSGFKFSNMNGTTNLSDSTIKVKGTAVSFGPSNSTTRGYANVSNSTLDSTGVYISTVKASTFDTVTFDNTWYDSAITFTAGGATNTFTNCEFKADVDFQSANWAGKSVILTFNDCKYNGVDITAENIKDHFVFNNGTFGLQNRDNLTVIVNGTTVTL